MEQFALKPRICFGDDALAALKTLAGQRVLVVTDGFLAQSGLLGKLTAPLAGCTVEIFDRVTPDPSLKLVAQGVKVLQDFRPDAVVALGGGSPMDCAKAMKYFSSAAPPLYCVPTTAGTGSEVTSFAVLTDTARGVKYPVVDDRLLPEVAVLDASLLERIPPGVTADTGMDVLTHALEAYVSRKATAFTDALAQRAFVLAYENLAKAYHTDGPGEAKEQMLLASCMAGMAFNAASLGVCHSLAHALGGRYHVPHGRLNAILLPHVVEFNSGAASRYPPRDEQARKWAKGAAAKYGHLAGLCGLAPTPRALLSALVRLRGQLALPETLTEPIAVEEISATALADVCTPTNPRAVTQGDLEQILGEVGP